MCIRFIPHLFAASGPPKILVFPAGEWSGQLQGTELTSGRDDDVPIHHALKIAAIMVGVCLDIGWCCVQCSSAHGRRVCDTKLF